jgi:hypothetical protein
MSFNDNQSKSPRGLNSSRNTESSQQQRSVLFNQMKDDKMKAALE